MPRPPSPLPRVRCVVGQRGGRRPPDEARTSAHGGHLRSGKHRNRQTRCQGGPRRPPSARTHYVGGGGAATLAAEVQGLAQARPHGEGPPARLSGLEGRASAAIQRAGRQCMLMLMARHALMIAVGTAITGRPPHRSGRARFRHPGVCQRSCPVPHQAASLILRSFVSRSGLRQTSPTGDQLRI